MHEKDIEDFICQHPEALFGEDTVLIGRQIRLPHGRLDALVWHQLPYIIEIKAHKIRPEDVTQVLRYKDDIDVYLSYAYARAISNFYQQHDTMTLSEDAFVDNLVYRSGEPMPRVLPMLIGRSIDENTWAACSGADIRVRLWRHDAASQSFSFAGPNTAGPDFDPHTPPPWVTSIINIATSKAMEAGDQYLESVIRDLFITAGEHQ